MRLKYHQHGKTRLILISDLHQLYAYTHADEIIYKSDGTLCLNEIKGEPPPNRELTGAYIHELTADDGTAQETWFYYNGKSYQCNDQQFLEA